MMKKRGLGKGLDALIPTVDVVAPHRVAEGVRAQKIPMARIIAGTGQPRQHFAQDTLAELSESIREKGVIQPILVRRKSSAKTASGDQFQILVGERRYRAAKIAGLSEIPAIIVDASDRDALELALVENVQREDLNPMEEARAYERLMREFDLGQEEVSKRVGKSRASVANSLRLLKLPSEIQDALESGSLSPGHARAILSLEEQSKQLELKSKIISEGLSVREAEALARRMISEKIGAEGKVKKTAARTAEVGKALKDLEDKLLAALGTRVRVKPVSREKGKIEIYYSSIEDIERILELLGVNID
jgi:ParB family chromosome partitioning protein